MAPNSKGKKKGRNHRDAHLAPAPVLPSPSNGVATSAPSFLLGTATAAQAGWRPGASFGSPREIDSSQANPCVNPWLYPPGRFLNYLQRPPFSPFGQGPEGCPENFHFVGGTQNFGSFSPPPAPFSKGTASAPSAAGPKKNVIIDIDDANVVEVDRSARRLHWTHDEEVRLASAWLKHSNDPIDGNGKKNEKFWGQVTEEFNSNTPADRKRDINGLKQHWQRLKSTITHFNNCWSRVLKKHGSGMSDDQVMDEALKLFESEKGKPFTLIHWWRTLKNQPKWCAHVDLMAKEKNKQSTMHSDGPSDVTDVETGKRPIGRDAAKAKHNGKRKKQGALDGVVFLGEKIDKVVEAQTAARNQRIQMTEVQQHMSYERLEAARLSREAAKEQKEAKMLEVLNSLLCQDTSGMTDQAKVAREKAIQILTDKLFGTNN